MIKLKQSKSLDFEIYILIEKKSMGDESNF